MLLTTLLREWLAPEGFARVAEPDCVMDCEEAVTAFARAGRPDSILSGVYAFVAELACRATRPGDAVLDLGCGPASLLATIAARNPQASFTGIDAAPRMLAAGEALLRGTGAANAELRLDDMTRLSTVAPGSIDLVLSSMAIHHLPDTEALHRCFEAVDRVLRPDGRVVIADFGRLRRLASIDYFVRRAIPEDEAVLERDYRASLRAAFSPDELRAALPAGLRDRISLYETPVSPMMVVLMTPLPPARSGEKLARASGLRALPRARRADYLQLYYSLRLGGLPVA